MTTRRRERRDRIAYNCRQRERRLTKRTLARKHPELDVPNGLYFDRGGRQISMLTWAMRFEDDRYRRVLTTRVRSVRACVSTIWLGLHDCSEPPRIFETAVSGRGKSFEIIARYATEAEARREHAAIVEALSSVAS
jgi:hypothetical protein